MAGQTDPSFPRSIADLERRVQELERLWVRDVPEPSSELSLEWSMPGYLSVQESTPKYTKFDATVTTLRVSLREAGTTTTTVKLNVNGTARYTVSLTSGVLTSLSAVNLGVASSDALTIDATAVGDAAAHLSVQAWYR